MTTQTPGTWHEVRRLCEAFDRVVAERDSLKGELATMTENRDEMYREAKRLEAEVERLKSQYEDCEVRNMSLVAKNAELTWQYTEVQETRDYWQRAYFDNITGTVRT